MTHDCEAHTGSTVIYSRPLRISRYDCRYGYEEGTIDDVVVLVLCRRANGVVDSVDVRPPYRILEVSGTEWTLCGHPQRTDDVYKYENGEGQTSDALIPWAGREAQRSRPQAGA